MAQIENIYHSHNGVDGYRNMTVYLARRGYDYSPTTIHKYMNVELGLHSVVRPHSFNEYLTPYQARIESKKETDIF